MANKGVLPNRSMNLCVIKGQSHIKSRLLWLRIESYRSEMLLDNSLHGIESSAQLLPERLCSEERFEHTIGTLRRDSVARISDFYEYRFFLQSRGEGECAGAIH